MSRRPRKAALAVVGMATMIALASVGTSGVMADPAGGGEPAPQPAGGSEATDAAQSHHTVTLLTGDRVTVTEQAGGRTVTAEPGADRPGITFVEQETADGALRVIPVDALSLVAGGRLDPRLFDVTGLIEQGYDDTSADRIPLIVQYDDGPQARNSAPDALDRAGAEVERELPSVQGAAVQVPKDTASDLWEQLTVDDDAPKGVLSAGIASIRLDGQVQASLDESVPLIGAPAAWDAGYTGNGVRVAVLDTGIDAGHPDLSDAVLQAEDFTDDWDGNPNNDPTDRIGHGTHVASIVTGSGAASDGSYAGVAPDTQLLVGKVLDDEGSGTESWIIAGMEWAVDHGADVVNMSLGGCATDGSDPMSQAVNALTEQSGALFVVAAGNHPSWCGESPELVSSPASADRALAVGSVNKAGELSEFSNVGPRLGDGAIKPELTAPGEAIVAARAEGTLDELAEGEHYARLSGTSMAAPHVAGVAALLVEQHPEWTADELLSALQASAVPRPALGAFQQGAGRVDAARAVTQEVFASPASLSMGLAKWPHDDDEPVTTPLTYRSTDDEPVTLDLSITAVDANGKPAPPGLFSIDTSEITVPAGGTSEVTVTADTTIQAPDGEYSGRITATGPDGTPTVTTPIGVVKEVESYDLTIEAIDRTGEPSESFAYLSDLSSDELPREVYFPGEPVTLRVPAGRYDVTGAVWTLNPDDSWDGSLTIAAKPEITLDRDITVSLDAREGRLVEASVDSQTAQSGLRRAYLRVTDRLTQGIGTDIETFGLFATPTPEVTTYDYSFSYQTALAEPLEQPGGATTTSDEPPRGYQLHFTEPRRIPPDPSYRVRDSELARLDTTVHAQGIAEPHPGFLIAHPWKVDGWASWGQWYEIEMPSERIDLYSEDASIGWETWVQTPHVEESDNYDQYQHYNAGRRYEKHWNAAPLGPMAQPAFRGGDLWAGLAPFSSSSPRHYTYPSPDGVETITTLKKNGEVVGTSDDPSGGIYELEPEPATYELTTSATRDTDWSTLATQVDATWAATAGPSGEHNRLPFLTLRASGDVDLLGRAPTRRPFRLDLRVERADGVEPEVRDIEMEASFDDGSTWRKVRVRPVADGFVARVPRPPSNAEFVSLRASVEDTDGGRLDQTVIRAYQLAR